MNKALVVLSGGQDSAACLLWALNRYRHVEALTFDYGQRHGMEMVCAEDLCDELGVEQTVVDLKGMQAVQGSALIDHDMEVEITGGMNDLPSTFVPGRNLVFLSLASGIAVSKGLLNVVTGVCQTDYSGYPDCRRHTIDALELACRLGTDTDRLRIHTPVMYLDKAQTWELSVNEGMNLGYTAAGAEELIVEHTHTCYQGVRISHGWGYGCGTCPACRIRAKGWQEWRTR